MSWQEVRLEMVACYSKDMVSTDVLTAENFINVENLRKGGGKVEANKIPSKTKVTKYEKGDMLLSNIRPYLKKYWFADSDGGCSADVLVIRPDKHKILPKLLYLILSEDKFFVYEMSSAKGIKMPRGDKTQIMNYKFLLPDLKTQKKIVAILEKWDATIENLKQQILEEEKILKSLCKNVFDSGIFAEVKLADIAVLYQPKTIAESELQLSGYPVYGANGLIGYYDKYNHESSQIAITCRGSTCGTVNLVPGFSWITGNAMVVNIDDNENINQKYLYYFLKNINFKPFISGSGQPQIVKTSLSKMKIKVPDLKEQLKIALILDAQDQKLSLLRQKLSNYESQRKYLLNRLLSGKEDI